MPLRAMESVVAVPDLAQSDIKAEVKAESGVDNPYPNLGSVTPNHSSDTASNSAAVPESVACPSNPTPLVTHPHLDPHGHLVPPHDPSCNWVGNQIFLSSCPITMFENLLEGFHCYPTTILLQAP